jgi:hypothetical protein
MRVTEPSRFFVLDARQFSRLMHEWFPMAVHLLEGMFFGQSLRSRRGASGCSRSARCRYLAHELNNPAAAGVGQPPRCEAGHRHAAQAGHDRGRDMGQTVLRR